MNVRYVSQDKDLGWSEEMKDLVQRKMIVPLQKALKSNHFELSLNLNRRRQGPKNFEIWAVVQCFDGRNNQVVRRQGSKFSEMITQLARDMLARLQYQPIAAGSLGGFWDLFTLETAIEKTDHPLEWIFHRSPRC